MALIDQNTLALDATFQARVRVAALKTAVAVMGELESTPNHAGRFNYASRVIQEPATFTGRIAYLTVTNTTIAASAPTGITATDADIEWVVNFFWDILSSEQL